MSESILVNPDAEAVFVDREREALAVNSPECVAKCCGPPGVGWIACVPCPSPCFPSFMPPVLYVLAMNVPGGAGTVFSGPLGYCYRASGTIVWDCRNHGPAPDGTICAPDDFYLPGVRFGVAGMTSLFCGHPSCTQCPEIGTRVRLRRCSSCINAAINCPDLIAFDGEWFAHFDWFEIIALLEAQVGTPLAGKCLAIRSGDCCFELDIMRVGHLDVIGPNEPGPRPPIAPIDGVFEACCGCAEAVRNSGTGHDCTAASEAGGAWRCAPAGIRRDWWKIELCPPQVPVGLACCCPGDMDPPDAEVPYARILIFNSERTTYSPHTPGFVTRTVIKGAMPGRVRIREYLSWVPDPSAPASDVTYEFPAAAACHPLTPAIPYMGRVAHNCGTEYTITITGNCRRADMVETSDGPDYYDRLEYHGGFEQTNIDAIDAEILPLLPPGAGDANGFINPDVFWTACNAGCGANDNYLPPGHVDGPGGRPGSPLTMTLLRRIFTRFGEPTS